jgi:hypothetical protein
MKPKPYNLLKAVEPICLAYHGSPVPDHWTPAWDVPTPEGVLRVTPFDRWIACQFRDFTDKGIVKAYGGDFNTYSHKWNINWHDHSTGKAMPERCAIELERRLRTITQPEKYLSAAV